MREICNVLFVTLFVYCRLDRCVTAFVSQRKPDSFIEALSLIVKSRIAQLAEAKGRRRREEEEK